MGFEAFRDADKHYRECAKKAAKLAQARGEMPGGSTRARVTTANAKWARAAEAREVRERQLRAIYDSENGRATVPYDAEMPTWARCGVVA